MKKISSLFFASCLIFSSISSTVSAASENTQADMNLTAEDMEVVSFAEREPEVYLSKTDLQNAIQQAYFETGKDSFLNVVENLNPSILQTITFNEDGTVNMDQKSNLKLSDSSTEAIFNFESALKEYGDRIKQYNEKLGIDSNGIEVSNDGQLSIGGSGNGDGRNNLSLAGRLKGDIVLQNDPGISIQGYVNHAGIYDGTTSDYCIKSAQPNDGVLWESVSGWRKHDDAYILTTDYTSATQASAFNWANTLASVTEPYYWYSGKESNDSWYCSKIPWKGYYQMGIDLDSDGGVWVMPDDLLNSSHTFLVGAFD